eukprot:942830-Amphidinium_carterae.1
MALHAAVISHGCKVQDDALETLHASETFNIEMKRIMALMDHTCKSMFSMHTQHEIRIHHLRAINHSCHPIPYRISPCKSSGTFPLTSLSRYALLAKAFEWLM